MSIEGKNVIITGASAGIGEACAKLFARNGANLILTARRINKLNELADSLRSAYNVKVHTIEMDVRNFDEVKKKFENLPAEFKTIDVLINNAGKALGVEKIQDGVLSNWEEMLDTNVKGLLYVSKIIIPMLIKQNHGHIINIGSIAGHEVYPGGNVYCASKFAVRAISKGMGIDLSGYNIKVTSIDPGMVETEFSLVRFAGDEEKAKNVYKGVDPLVGDDIADIALFAATRPEHVDLREIVVTPTAQSSATIVHRK
ncbi:MAG: SDR family NAD(P)-dependent oxidoreductase [Bacteroidetes bacterium]|nr:SDR family NAD(P)-dependent oxidoreductase [Bacteroidota bacterium]